MKRTNWECHLQSEEDCEYEINEEQEEFEGELRELRKQQSLFVTCKPWLHRINQIHGLPCMINLTSLTLHMNGLSELDNGVLLHLRELEELDVSANEITSISAYTFAAQHKLKRLNLSSNELHSIASNAFETLHSLEWLCLAFNVLDDITCISHISTKAHLTHLDVCGNHISTFDHVESMLSRHRSHIRSLRLRVPSFSRMMNTIITEEVNNSNNNKNKKNNDYIEGNERGRAFNSMKSSTLRTTEEKYKKSTNKEQEEELESEEEEQQQSNEEYNTKMNLLNDNPFLQCFTSNIEYVKRILDLCPNLTTLDGEVCGMNALELVQERAHRGTNFNQVNTLHDNVNVIADSQSNQQQRQEHKTTKNNHHSITTNAQRRATRSHSRPLLTTPQSYKKMRSPESASQSSSVESTSSSSKVSKHHIQEQEQQKEEIMEQADKAAFVPFAPTNETTTTATATAVRSLNFCEDDDDNNNNKEVVDKVSSQESSYDVSLLEAELNDVIINEKKQKRHFTNENISQNKNIRYNTKYINHDDVSGKNAIKQEHQTFVKNSNLALHNSSLSNVLLDKMEYDDAQCNDGDVELCELRSGRPVHSLRWRPHRRSIGLNTLISIRSKELEEYTHPESSKQLNNSNIVSSSSNKYKNDHNNALNDNSSDNIYSNNNSEGKVIDSANEEQQMRHLLYMFGMHSKLVHSLEHDKKTMHHRLCKAMQQIALQRATEAELRERLSSMLQTLHAQDAKGKLELSKRVAQISSLKDELLRRAGEVQIVHKRANADITLLNKQWYNHLRLRTEQCTCLLTSEFISRLRLMWEEWVNEREHVKEKICSLIAVTNVVQTEKNRIAEQHAREFVEWKEKEHMLREERIRVEMELQLHSSLLFLETSEAIERYKVIEQQEQCVRFSQFTLPWVQMHTETITRVHLQETYNATWAANEEEWHTKYESLKVSYDEALTHANNELDKVQLELNESNALLKRLQEKQERHQQSEKQQEQCKKKVERESWQTISLNETENTIGGADATSTVNNSVSSRNNNNKAAIIKTELSIKSETESVNKLNLLLEEEEEEQMKYQKDENNASLLDQYWRGMCAKREQEVENLKVACDVSESTQQVLSQENSRLLLKINELQKEFEIKINHFTREKDNILRTLHNVEDSLKKKDKELNLLEEEAKEKINEKRTRIAELEQINDELIEEKATVAEQNVKLRNSLESVESKLHSIQSTLQNAEHTNKLQSERISTLEKQIEEMKSKSAQNVEVERQHVTMKTTLITALHSARDQLVTLHQSYLALLQQQQLWEAKCNNKDEEIQRLQRQVNELESSSRERQRATLAALSQVILNEHSAEANY